jgi:predicted dehydrogenase
MVATALPGSMNVLGAQQKLRLAMMGVHGRGTALTRGFSQLDGVEIAYVCDPDHRVLAPAAKVAEQAGQPAPKLVKDFRRALEDSTVDALVIATPNHWHAPATILACNAGKHVYVEKPASHNPAEGEWMVAAARKHHRVVQLGTQRRSLPRIIEAMNKLQAGELGKVTYAKSWYNAARGPIGHGHEVPVPEWLDWELWQGPAPERPYRDNVVHYNWHWFWHWGNGELGNNGVHSLDICRWGLGVEFPRTVTSGGGRYAFDDDQETPDTNLVTFDFGNCLISWEGQSCRKHGFEGMGFGAAFYGEKGTMIITSSGYRLLDRAGKPAGDFPAPFSDRPHFQNFVDTIRGQAQLNAEISIGHRSTLLCHLGNIAWRTGRTVHCDPANGHIQNDPEAAALWERQYRPGWKPVV